MKTTKVKRATMIATHYYGGCQAEDVFYVHTESGQRGWIISFGGDYRLITNVSRLDIRDKKRPVVGSYDEELCNGMIGSTIEV